MNFDPAFAAIERSEYGDHLVKGRAAVLLEAALAQSDDFNLATPKPKQIVAIEEPFRIDMPDYTLAGMQDAVFKYEDRLEVKEWKTIRAPYGRDKEGQREKWKRAWQRDPQFLMYALATRIKFACDARPIYFHFQRIEKSNPPYLYDFRAEVEDADIRAAEDQLLLTFETIINFRNTLPGGPWLRNYGYYAHCFAFGKECSFFKYCSGKADDPATGIPSPRRQNLDTFHQGQGETVIEASGIKALAQCPEKFRLQWELGHGEPATESLIMGTLFHEGMGAAYKVLSKELQGG